MTAQVSELWWYPIRGLMGERVESLSLDRLSGDESNSGGGEAFVPWDVSADRPIEASETPELRMAQARTEGESVISILPDGSEVVAGTSEAESSWSAWLGRSIELRPGDRRLSTVRILALSSVAALARRHPEGQWDPRRFEPDVVVVTPGLEFAEDGWVGHRIEVGSVELVGRERAECTEDCGVRRVGLAHDPTIVTVVRARHDGTLGVLADVVAPGTVRLADAVDVSGR